MCASWELQMDNISIFPMVFNDLSLWGSAVRSRAATYNDFVIINESAHYFLDHSVLFASIKRNWEKYGVPNLVVCFFLVSQICTQYCQELALFLLRVSHITVLWHKVHLLTESLLYHQGLTINESVKEFTIWPSAISKSKKLQFSDLRYLR